MLRRSNLTALFAGAAAVAIASLGLTTTAGASTSLSSVVAPTPANFTPNVYAGPSPAGEAAGCNSTFFGASTSGFYCQSEVYDTAYVNGEVVVSGAFTQVCAPGPASNGYCATGTKLVTRDDIFAYTAGTGAIDPNFVPVLNQGPAWTVAAGPAGSNTVYVGGAFTTVNGLTQHKGLVELNVNPGVTTGTTADGSVVTAFKATVSNEVRDIDLSPDGTALYVGGQFTSIDSTMQFAPSGPAVDSLARLNATTGALDTSFAFTLGDPIKGLPTKIEAMTLSPDGTQLAFSGTALEVNGQPRPRLAIVNTGGTLGAASSLSDWTAPILNNNCSNEHDYVRGLDFSPDGTFVVTADTGYVNDGSQPYSVCDAVARFDVNAANTTATGTPVDVPPAWINYSGGDSFYSVAIAGNVVYAGGHNRWINNYCGRDVLCGPNAELTAGLSAFDANTGVGLAWWHPLTLRGQGTMYLSTFPAGTDDGANAGLYMGTGINNIAGDYRSEEAVFPIAAPTSAAPGGPIPSGMFNEEAGSNLGLPMCIDDPGNISSTGTPVELATCTNGTEQNWSIAADGTIQINGMCLDIAGGSTVRGTTLALDTCSGSSTQQWTQGAGNTVLNTGAGTANATPMCLVDPNSSTTAGTKLQIWVCNGGLQEVWPLPVAQGPPTTPANGEIFSQNTQKNTQVACMDDIHNSSSQGNKVVLWTCTGDAEQQWTVSAGNTFTIEVNGRCLDTLNGISSGPEPTVVNQCNGSATQQWTVAQYAGGGNNYEVVNVGATNTIGSPYCLDDSDANTVNGTQLETWVCNGRTNQSWRLPGA